MITAEQQPPPLHILHRIRIIFTTKVLPYMRSSPPDLWRPSLPLTRALDLCFSAGQSPAALLDPSSVELLAACLNRHPDLAILDHAPSPRQEGLLDLLAGYQGIYQSLQPTAQPMFRLIIAVWHSLAKQQSEHVARWLCPGGTLAVLIFPRLPWQLITFDLFMVRRFIRSCSCQIDITEGYLGPQALAWSVAGCLARHRGHLQAYDYCHAMMRVTVRSGWPAALLSRSAIVVGRKRT